jgi:hypothetical protein
MIEYNMLGILISALKILLTYAFNQINSGDWFILGSFLQVPHDRWIKRNSFKMPFMMIVFYEFKFLCQRFYDQLELIQFPYEATNYQKLPTSSPLSISSKSHFEVDAWLF